MQKFIDVNHPVYVCRLKSLGLFPEDLTHAFEILFNPDDLCIYYPTAFDESPDISFYIFNIRDNQIYHYKITADDWIFRDDEDGVDTIVNELADVEEVYDRRAFKDLLHTMQYRLVAVPELSALQKFDNFLDGIASYVTKENDDEKDSQRKLPGAGRREAGKEA